MGTDKGKARKSLARDKVIDRVADIFLTAPATGKGNAGKPVADALRHRATKANISQSKRQSYLDTAKLMDTSSLKSSGDKSYAKNVAKAKGGSYARNYSKNNDH